MPTKTHSTHHPKSKKESFKFREEENPKNRKDLFKNQEPKKNKRFFRIFKKAFLLIASLGLILVTIIVIYISTLTIPDFSNFADRKVDNSTQIYDRTGKILLYDVHGDIKRVQVESSEISNYSKEATVAIEDKHFYEHQGIRLTSIVRAILVNLKEGAFVQGGSTIDQQVIKNALLSRKKSFIRKITEWAMAIKLDAQVPKDTVLTIYLNDAAYGGTIYGIQTASRYFFSKDAKDLTLAEAVYLAAIPNAPSYYSPYGNHVDELESRKALILKLMLEQGKITQEQYSQALVEKVIWNKNVENGKAMHFVFFVRDYLEEKYGKDVVDKGGLKVITTLDYDYQSKAEEIVNKYALENAKNFNAQNAGLIALDPKTGQILTMVGSRDYYDTEIDGNYNVTTAERQPGSSFKPIVYATAFMKGYSPETVLFDVPTEFSTTCTYNSLPIPPNTKESCFHPQNYDEKFRGPVTMREALAQSLNIPAVKTLYLAGVKDSITTGQKLGITTLDINGNYGLSLVLGTGGVTLLEMTKAYSVFANEGVSNPYAFILEVRDSANNVLEKYSQNNSQAIPQYIADEINDVLADNVARTPLYGPNSKLYFPGYEVAAKTGTTNEYRDTWTIGYTPSLAVGVWAGNNNNQRINKGMSGMVAVPMWSEFMQYAIPKYPKEAFLKPILPEDQTVDNKTPPVRGLYCYTGNGVNYSYSILNQDSSQYYLWKIPEDIWMQSHTCPFTQNSSDSNSSSIDNTSTSTLDSLIP